MTTEQKGDIVGWLRRRAHNDTVPVSGKLAGEIADHIEKLEQAQAAPVMDERAEFDKWLQEETGHKGIWNAWQRRALLAAQPSPRCEHCDGTGEVHNHIGEWLGTCTCPAGKPAPTVAGGELPPLPRPLDIDYPQFDRADFIYKLGQRGINDIGDAAAFAWQDGLDRAANCVPEDIYDSEMLRAYGDDRVRAALASQQAAGVPVGYECRDTNVLGSKWERCEKRDVTECDKPWLEFRTLYTTSPTGANAKVEDLAARLEYAQEDGRNQAIQGLHELMVNEDSDIEIDSSKPICRFRMYQDSGDASVGLPARSYWALDDDLTGTVLGDLMTKGLQP